MSEGSERSSHAFLYFFSLQIATDVVKYSRPGHQVMEKGKGFDITSKSPLRTTARIVVGGIVVDVLDQTRLDSYKSGSFSMCLVLYGGL